MSRAARRITTRVVALAASILTASVAFADARTTARRYFQKGLSALEGERFDEAIEAFTIANQTIPHPDVQYNLARACADAGRYAEAIKWFEVYLKQSSSPPDGREIEAVIRTLKSRIRAPLEITPPPTEGPPPTPLEPGELPEDTTADVARLRKTAGDLRPLSAERAAELERIAERLIALAQQPAPATPSSAPLPAGETTAPPDKLVITLPTEKVREVEDYEEQEVVTAATGEATKPEDVPAVAWVITQREIRQRGYESVAEVLRNIAGLHVIDDLVFVDVGVRGVQGGLRGQTRLLKVLINGQPVSFRPTSGNFLGPEMVPIRAVDRIELIRGPASALYGANAFLGVLQIVTRRGGDIRGGSLAGRWGVSTSAQGLSGRSVTPQSGSGDMIVGTQTGDMSVLVSGFLGAFDRSGLAVPESSPLAEALIESRGGLSSEDRSGPISLFGSVHYDLQSAGQLTMESGFQRLHSRAEWLDFGTLTHFSRVVLHNFWARLGYDNRFNEQLGLSAYASYTQAGPGNGHRLRNLRPSAVAADETSHLVERFGSKALTTGTEVRWDFSRQFGLRAGADLDLDFEDLTSADVVFDRNFGVYQAGDVAPIPDAQQGSQRFINTGVYLQLSAEPLSWMNLIGGVRFDYHNLYDASFNGRVGSVFRFYEGLYAKVLYGSSFRAPAPDQLFHGAAYIGDTIGCENFEPCQRVALEPQTAHTGELVLGYNLTDRISAQLTGYLSFVDNLIISFPTQGEFFVTTNAGSYLSTGLELEVSGEAPGLPAWFELSGHMHIALNNTAANIPETQFDPPESIREEFREAPLFPDVSGGGGIDFAFPPAKLGLYIEGRYVGPRRASGSNLALGNAGYVNDKLPAYFELDMNLSTRDLYVLADGETVFSLRLTDIGGSPHAEGGYRGWDVPTRGRTVFLRLIQEF